jgi:formylglycine-generating enzyme required for sulfatase activity
MLAMPVQTNSRYALGPTDLDAMLAELDNQETKHKRRLLIGERLDVLGEHPFRWGVGVGENWTPRIDWCRVPGGEVTISILSDPDAPYSDVEDTVSTQVEAFHIARYSVTVAQYRAFIVAEDGWRDPAWWGGDLYREEEGNTYEVGRFGNHPAVYVSWFDAMAFCRWLSRRLGFPVRLPDEWEWQQAATAGNAENVFPWGPDWDAKKEPWRANTFESRLGQPTAVGMYPAGASPVGALDMVGTVWEWCLNKFDSPGVTQSRADDFERRVLRGGSWYAARYRARGQPRQVHPGQPGQRHRFPCGVFVPINWALIPESAAKAAPCRRPFTGVFEADGCRPSFFESSYRLIKRLPSAARIATAAAPPTPPAPPPSARPAESPLPAGPRGWPPGYPAPAG